MIDPREGAVVTDSMPDEEHWWETQRRTSAQAEEERIWQAQQCGSSQGHEEYDMSYIIEDDCHRGSNATEESEDDPVMAMLARKSTNVNKSAPLPEGVRDVGWVPPTHIGLAYSSAICETEMDVEGRISVVSVNEDHAHFREWQQDNGVATALGTEPVEKMVDGKSMVVRLSRPSSPCDDPLSRTPHLGGGVQPQRSSGVSISGVVGDEGGVPGTATRVRDAQNHNLTLSGREAFSLEAVPPQSLHCDMDDRGDDKQGTQCKSPATAATRDYASGNEGRVNSQREGSSGILPCRPSGGRVITHLISPAPGRRPTAQAAGPASACGDSTSKTGDAVQTAAEKHVLAAAQFPSPVCASICDAEPCSVATSYGVAEEGDEQRKNEGDHAHRSPQPNSTEEQRRWWGGCRSPRETPSPRSQLPAISLVAANSSGPTVSEGRRWCGWMRFRGVAKP